MGEIFLLPLALFPKDLDPFNRFCRTQANSRQTDKLTDTPRYEIIDCNKLKWL